MRALPQPLGKFFADRGPHLAAMIAYFALLSFVPLLFLTISLLSLAGRPDESSYLVTELKRAFPGSSVSSIVHTVREIQKHATALASHFVYGATTDGVRRLLRKTAIH